MTYKNTLWRWFFALAALEAGAAFFALVLIPHEGSSFSLSRLALLGLLFAFFVFGFWLAVRPPRRVDSLARPPLIIFSALLSLTFAAALFLLRYLNLKHVDPHLLLSYYLRLSPLLFYLIFLTFEFSLFSLGARYGFNWKVFAERKPIFQSSLIAFCVLLFVLLFVAVTRIGLIPDSAYWGEPGVPLLGWQFALALTGGLCVLCFAFSGRTRLLNFVIPVVLFLLAIIIWLNVPLGVMQSSFYAPMGPPTNIPFPYSDAGYYDSMAQSLLIGYPYQGNIPTRPLYIVLLAFLHWLFGQRYDLIIAGQTVVLALLPVVMYYIGRKIHSRAAGVIAALFVIFREWTSLLISSQTRVSNTKTLLVDLPTLLLILLACLFMLRWLERKDWKSALIAGGMFGLLLLLRTQSLLILPFILILAFFAFGWKNKKSFFLLSSFFILGLVVSVFPWLLHNYLASGQITFDAPFEYQVIASQYKYTGNLDLQSVDLQGKSLFGILLTFALEDPKFVLGFIAAHTFATQIDGLLVLPLIEKYNGLFAPVNLYWMGWNGKLAWQNLLLIIFYFALIAQGIGASWKRLRWAGLAPLAFSLGYALANGVARFSGWRYDLPADWVAYFYLGVGIAEIFSVFALSFGADAKKIFTPGFAEGIYHKDTKSQSRKEKNLAANKNFVQGFLIAGVFAFVSAIPWMAQGIAPPRYANQTPAMLTAELSASPAVEQLGIDQTQISEFMAQSQAALQTGRVLYPRFFYRGAGLVSTNPWPAYAARDFSRMGFLLLDQTRTDAIFQSRDIPSPFPQGADAVILGCQNQNYIDVRLILFPDSNSAFLSAPLADPCP